MDSVFTKFYTSYIQDIHAFLDSSADILYICGQKGCGKSSVLKNAVKKYDKNLLKFSHLCFKGTIIDDILLSFYDRFRTYAINGELSLKKNPESEFVQKVSFYFKNLETPCVIILDNFETIPNESEIIDFLIHVSGFENVKIIVISKEQTSRLIENPTIEIEKINFDKLDSYNFEQFFSKIYQNIPSEIFEHLYKITDGSELYIKMSLSYLEALNLSFEDFFDEFEKKNVPFEEFIIEKQASLISENYYPLLKYFSLITPNVSIPFLNEYNIGDEKELLYLKSKFIITEFFGTFYIKEHFRKYFIQNTNIQTRRNILNKLLAIYENELQKSPKDRLLRFSRETIRNQIELIKEKLPKTSTINTSPIFNYDPKKNTHWFITSGSKKTREEKKTQNKQEGFKTQQNTNNEEYEKALNLAIECESKYLFKEAVEYLFEAKKYAENFEQEFVVLNKIVNNEIKLNDNNNALKILKELSLICLNEEKIEEFSKTKIKTGRIYKKIYSFLKCKSCLNDVLLRKDEISKKTLVQAKMLYAEINELENNINEAIKNYEESFDIVKDEKEASNLLPEICYKTALLYEENSYTEEALKEYKNAIKYSENSNNDSYLIKSYTNLGVILFDMGENEDALYNLQNAFELSKNSVNHLENYYITRNIALIYKIINPEAAYEYLNLALEYAKNSNNSFEIAISLLELGDYYYDLKQNEQALICYFQAKATLGKDASKENLEKISIRINDMKIKLGNYLFNGMKELYDTD